MTNQAGSKRINDIFFGPLERPALQWLAKRMPAWVTPDTLTLFGLFGTILIFTSYALTGFNRHFLWLASLGYIINWFGDSLDGTLARYRHIERPRYGFMLDHLVDCFGSVLIVLGMGLSPFVNFTVASLTLITYLMVSILVYIVTITNGVFRISSGKIGPTELRVFLILANTVAFFYAKPLFTVAFGSFTIFDVLLAVMGIGLLVLYAVNSITESAKLAALEPATAIIAQRKAEARQAKIEALARKKARRQSSKRTHTSSVTATSHRSS